MHVVPSKQELATAETGLLLSCMEDTLLVLSAEEQIACSGLMLKPLQSGSFHCVLYRIRRRPSGEEGSSAKWLGGGVFISAASLH
ncbi:hypothetical protein NQZ68_032385 [Dissostichus eleginoides]|nr:hypothetical protein NQZ68_032385 [Dissostichus eleginoides]